MQAGAGERWTDEDAKPKKPHVHKGAMLPAVLVGRPPRKKDEEERHELARP